MLRTAYGCETVAIQMEDSATQDVIPSSGKYLNSAVRRRDEPCLLCARGRNG